MLLDLDPTGMGEEVPQPMKPSVAIDTLKSMFEKLESEGEPMSESLDSWKAVLCSNLGTNNQRIIYSNLEDISKLDMEGMHCLIIPDTPHEIELLALKRWQVE